MREIKFRGRCKDDGKWVFGSYVKTGTGLNYIIPQNLISNGNIQFLVDGKTIGEYTGIKDRNGKEIYEGDIVKRTYNGKTTTTGEVVFKEATYFIREVEWNVEGYSFLANQYNEELEVIGNIYENTDLVINSVDKVDMEE